MKIKCDNCTKITEKKPSRVKTYKNHFCGNICRLEWRAKFNKDKKIVIKCIICKKDVECYKKRIRKVCSKDCEIKLARIEKSGTKNPMWKGGKVGYSSLHEWITKHKLKPKVCEECKEAPPYDLANISGKYKRDVNDFEWLCRRCHMKKDGRLEKFKKVNKIC